MYRHCKYLVLLAVLAGAIPLSAIAARSTAGSDPTLAPVVSGPGASPPGTLVKLAYGASGILVSQLQVSMKLSGPVAFVRSPMPYRMVNGRRTWTIRNLPNLTVGKGFFFYVRISKHARIGSKGFVIIDGLAVNNELGWSKHYPLTQSIRVSRPK
jgi:hypothetical protein